uniref:DNA (Cytosine-5)-methyltransferase 1 n=1 Tax=Candidatus Kentrum sp. TC TaxID=2126339 RepID=A0A450YQK2_9GAMM|nr:MAG: DNA (cytosine-5)-methyltransferase 1 [Candidatus Kentron sp. TC]
MDIMTVKEAAEFMKVTPQTLYRLIREEDLPAFRLASEWRMERESLEEWVRGRLKEQGDRGAKSTDKTRPLPPRAALRLVK